MKNGKTALLCLALCLLALFGCAQEAGIPEGWVEYDLPAAGVKIALPPHYVLAAKELMPTDVDYERAGISTSMQEYFTVMIDDAFDDPRISACVISGKNEKRIIGVIAIGEVPDEVEWLGADTTTMSNVRRYAKLMVDMFKGVDFTVNYYEADGIIASKQLCYAIVESEYPADDGVEYYDRAYAALLEGQRIQISWGAEKEWVDDALIGEFDEIAKMLSIKH